MRVGPIIHGGLLLAALVVAYQTKTRVKNAPAQYGTEVIWSKSKVSALRFESEKKTVAIEWRADEQGEYLWGRVDRGGPSANQTEPETKTSREFPIGASGQHIMAQYETLHVMRNLGVLDKSQQKQYDLADDTSELTVFFGGTEKRDLRVANRSVFGGRDRYVLDLQTEIGYVISKDLLQPIRNAENSLALKTIHTYKNTLVTSVEIKTTTGDQIVLKGEKPVTAGKTRQVWHRQESPGKPDPALSSFLGRVTELKPSRYEVSLSPSDLEHIATLRYRNDENQVMGYLQMYRRHPTPTSLAQPADPIHSSRKTQYYIKTERTRVLGKVGRLIAERIDQDLVEIFGIDPPPRPLPLPTPLPKPMPSSDEENPNIAPALESGLTPQSR